jgi:hypothetical protein
MGEAALHQLLYRRSVPLTRTPTPDFAHIHRDLKRRGVTRLLLCAYFTPCRSSVSCSRSTRLARCSRPRSARDNRLPSRLATTTEGALRNEYASAPIYAKTRADSHERWRLIFAADDSAR